MNVTYGTRRFACANTSNAYTRCIPINLSSMQTRHAWNCLSSVIIDQVMANSERESRNGAIALFVGSYCFLLLWLPFDSWLTLCWSDRENRLVNVPKLFLSLEIVLMEFLQKKTAVTNVGFIQNFLLKFSRYRRHLGNNNYRVTQPNYHLW